MSDKDQRVMLDERLEIFDLVPKYREYPSQVDEDYITSKQMNAVFDRLFETLDRIEEGLDVSDNSCGFDEEKLNNILDEARKYGEHASLYLREAFEEEDKQWKGLMYQAAWDSIEQMTQEVSKVSFFYESMRVDQDSESWDIYDPENICHAVRFYRDIIKEDGFENPV